MHEPALATRQFERTGVKANSATVRPAELGKIEEKSRPVKNMRKLKTAMRVTFGVMWGIDAALKFKAGMAASIVNMLSSVSMGQPRLLSGWFSFWLSTISSNPGAFVYVQGVLELALAFCLIFGFLRKLAYLAGFSLSLMIWAIPEGFGGPYGTGSTDIGTGIIYAFVFLLLMSATYGTSDYSLDSILEKRLNWWRKLAELRAETAAFEN